MILDQAVQDYRNGDTEKYQQIIEHHLPIMDKLAWRFTSKRHTHEDITEIAYYELVQAVALAKKSLKNNNITPYIIKRVISNILTYLKMCDLIVHTNKPSSKTKLMEREFFLDTHVRTSVHPIDSLIFWECFNKSITSDLQHEIVILRLKKYTNKEILERLPECRNVTMIQRQWSLFVDTLLCVL